MSYVTVIDAPAATLVSLAEAKAHLRVDHGDDDVRIQGLIWAAQNEFAGPDGWLGRSISLQTLELRLDFFPSCNDIELPCPPLVVDETHPLSVKYTDGDGVEQTVDPALYSINTFGARMPSWIMLLVGNVWPATRWQKDAVRVRFSAGYAAGDMQAEAIKSAIKLHVQMNYDGADETKMRAAINNLLSTYRVF